MGESKQKKSNSKQAGRKPFDELDRIFHEKARLGILTAVISNQEGINFNDLKQQCELTDGNLNRHLKVLTDAKILKVAKTGRGRNTNSRYFMTALGRRAFESYLDALESIVRSAQFAAKGKSAGKNIALASEQGV